MTAAGVMFVTYLWHYLVARLIYDDLVRPLVHCRHVGVALAVACSATLGFLIGRRGR